MESRDGSKWDCGLDQFRRATRRGGGTNARQRADRGDEADGLGQRKHEGDGRTALAGAVAHGGETDRAGQLVLPRPHDRSTGQQVSAGVSSQHGAENAPVGTKQQNEERARRGIA